MPSPRLLRTILCAILLAVMAPTPIAAHEGHDDEPTTAAPARPRVAVHSDLYEVVAVREAPESNYYRRVAAVGEAFVGIENESFNLD